MPFRKGFFWHSGLSQITIKRFGLHVCLADDCRQRVPANSPANKEPFDIARMENPRYNKARVNPAGKELSTKGKHYAKEDTGL